MTKPVIVENMDECQTKVRIDTETWQRGPGAESEQADVPQAEPKPPVKPHYETPPK